MSKIRKTKISSLYLAYKPKIYTSAYVYATVTGVCNRTMVSYIFYLNVHVLIKLEEST